MTPYDENFNDDIIELYYYFLENGEIDKKELNELCEDDKKQLLRVVLCNEEEFEPKSEWNDDIDYNLMCWLKENIMEYEVDNEREIKNAVSLGFSGVFKFLLEQDRELVKKPFISELLEYNNDTKMFEEGGKYYEHMIKLYEIYKENGGI